MCLLTSLIHAAPPETTTVIRAARLFDARTGKMVSPGVVVVTGNKIVAVGPASAPAGAAEIEWGDATLMPGFIDAHTHLSFTYSDDYKQAQLDGLQKTIPELTLDATANASATLMAGFTTVRDVGSWHFVDVGLRNGIRSGRVPGPRMLVSVHAIGATGGHCDDGAGFREGMFGRETGPADGVINGAEEARRAVRLNVKYGADIIKTCATGGVLSPTDDVDTPQMTQDELNALVDEAHALRRKTAAHAHGATGAKRAIRAGIDSIEHGSFLDDEALSMMQAKGTVYIPTLMASWWIADRLERGTYYPPAVEAKARLAIASVNAVVRKAVERGVIIGLGTDAGVYPHGKNAHEFALLVNDGLTPAAALRAGTIVDAELLGLSQQIGTLESGKLADIVAVPGDPLSDIRQTEKVFFVMRNGQVYRNDRGHDRSVAKLPGGPLD